MASGSIAQIHKARLSEEGARGSEYPPGTVVAVKVLQAKTHRTAVQILVDQYVDICLDEPHKILLLARVSMVTINKPNVHCHLDS